MEPNGPDTIADKPFHVPSLDGGGANGFSAATELWRDW